MFNLDDILRQAQGGGAIDNLARQFGLSPEQAQSAVEAMMPAFQMGLQRQAQSAQSMGDLFGRIAGGRYGQAYDDADAARGSVGDGNDALSMLFGSKETSRAVAAQASAMSGVSASIIKAMLPVVASMLLGGMFKNVNNQGLGGLFGQLAEAFTGGARGGSSGGGLGDILGQMMGGGRAPQPQAHAQAPGGGGLGDLLGQMMGGRAGGAAAGGAAGGLGPLGDLLGQMMGGAAGGRAPAPGGGMGGGGLGDILGQMLGGGAGAGQAQAGAPQGDLPRTRGRVEDEISDMLGGGRSGARLDPRRAPPQDEEAGPEEEAAAEDEAGPQGGQPTLQDIFGQMFQTGREVQQGQQDALRDIFEQMMGQRRR
ncbi:MAG: DUF937 domain-containing protein [Methylobacteriaceae bacterium]|nr:DUF937 domain-containing protein [Methylobacteriaceae bacterium]